MGYLFLFTVSASTPPSPIEEILAQSCFLFPFCFLKSRHSLMHRPKTNLDNVKIHITEICPALAVVASSPMVSVQEAEEKRKRLEEAEKKRQAMMQEWGHA